MPLPGLQGEVNLDVEDGGEQVTGDVHHTSAFSIFSGLSVEASGLFSGSPLLGLLLTQTDRHLSYLRCTPTRGRSATVENRGFGREFGFPTVTR